MAHDARIQRFCLLSGADFPIKPNPCIIREFDSDTEFLRIDRKLDPNQTAPYHRNVAFHWFVGRIDERVRPLSGKLKRKPYDGLTLYHGSQWWAVTRNCADYILNFLSSNPDYFTYFETVFCADEIFFHSIIKSSAFADRITHDFEATADTEAFMLSNEHGCHYIDWTTHSGTQPKVLGMDDFDRLRQSNCLFARKFDEQHSRELTDQVERLLGSKKSVADCPVE
jgi:hypothetical protein